MHFPLLAREFSNEVGRVNTFPFHRFPGVLRRRMSCAQERVSSPRRLTAPRVSKEDSLAEPRPRAGELEQHSHLWDCLLLHAHTESSSLHTQDTELFLTGHITCVPTGHLQELISSFLSFSPSSSPSFPFYRCHGILCQIWQKLLC